MLLLGPEGGNLEVGESELTFHGKDGGASSIAYDLILCVKIIEGYKLEISFTDFNDDYLKVKRISQAAIDVAMLQKVHASIQVN